MQNTFPLLQPLTWFLFSTDPKQRVYYEVNKEAGTLVLVIKNVTEEDSGTFVCWMYRGKKSDPVKVDILGGQLINNQSCF